MFEINVKSLAESFENNIKKLKRNYLDLEIQRLAIVEYSLSCGGQNKDEIVKMYENIIQVKASVAKTLATLNISLDNITNENI